MRGSEVASPEFCPKHRPLNRESCDDPQCGQWIYGAWGQVSILNVLIQLKYILIKQGQINKYVNKSTDYAIQKENRKINILGIMLYFFSIIFIHFSVNAIACNVGK